MSEPVVVTLDRRSYTWDGQRWYGTEDHMAPPRGLLPRLLALLSAAKPAEKPKPDAPRRR
jgi:hypothetical protein